MLLSPCMGGPVELATTPNGAIANKRIVDGIDKAGWLNHFHRVLLSMDSEYDEYP